MIFTVRDYFSKLFHRSRNLNSMMGDCGACVQNVPSDTKEQLKCLDDYEKNLAHMQKLINEEIIAVQFTKSKIESGEVT